MTLRFGFYNSVNGDRVYDANDFGRFLDNIITDGVLTSFGTFAVGAGSGYNVQVNPGRAWFNETYTIVDTDPYPVTISAPSSSNRIDVVSLCINKNTRTNSFVVTKGTAASSPTAPTVSNTSGVYYYPLCNVTVPSTAKSSADYSYSSLIGTNSAPIAVLAIPTSVSGVQFGVTTATTDASGNVYVSHSLGVRPRVGLGTLNSPAAGRFLVYYPPGSSATSANFVLFMADGSTRFANTSVTISWTLSV